MVRLLAEVILILVGHSTPASSTFSPISPRLQSNSIAYVLFPAQSAVTTLTSHTRGWPRVEPSPARPHPLGEAPGPHQPGVSLVEAVQVVAFLGVEDQAVPQSTRVIHCS